MQALIDHKSNSTSKVVYFDQNKWIDIARMYYGNPPERERRLLNGIINASDAGTMVFPLSVGNLLETNKISDSIRRRKMAFLLTRISKGYSFQPYINRVIDAEIHNLVLTTLGLKTNNIRNYVLKKG